MKDAPLVQVTLQRGCHSLVRYKGAEARNLKKRVQVVRVEDFIGRRRWPRGLYLFTTLDSMTPGQKAAARWLWRELGSRPDCFARLNDPDKTQGRYSLLRTLHEKGINDFNVHLLSDLSAVRFPAFVRYENLHRANLTGLVRSRDELEDAVAAMLTRGERPEDLMVTEFVDYKSDDGLYRKWGAHICGTEILAKHVFVGRQWMLKKKYSVQSLVGGEEFEYISTNPHAKMLEPVFEASGCDWARVDYSFWRGRLQVWEVNDNPEMGSKWKYDVGRRKSHAVFFRRFETAIDRLCDPIEPGSDVEFSLPASEVTRSL